MGNGAGETGRDIGTGEEKEDGATKAQRLRLREPGSTMRRLATSGEAVVATVVSSSDEGLLGGASWKMEGGTPVAEG